MIESENLRTASLYINNQLLSRGLLRDGNGIDFAHPGDTDAEVAETMSRVMAVINDLILRRDVSSLLYPNWQILFLHFCCTPRLSSLIKSSHRSATLNIASPSRPPCGPSVPSPYGRPTTSSACRKSTPRRSGRLA